MRAICLAVLLLAVPAISHGAGAAPDDLPFAVGSYASPMMSSPVPPYLANGATNLDYVWMQDGGARLYWDYVMYPQELKMGGMSWQDPALVPPLFAPANSRAVPRAAPVRVAPSAKAPANAGSTALRLPAQQPAAQPVVAQPVSTIPPQPVAQQVAVPAVPSTDIIPPLRVETGIPLVQQSAMPAAGASSGSGLPEVPRLQ